MLARAGFQTMTGLTDSRELPALLVDAPPDLVITDLHMPRVDGFGVLDMLTPLINQERLPVLVVTGDASIEARQQALTRGAKDFVTKPFDMVEVLLRVRNLLESRMLFQDLRKQNRTLLESATGRTRELESTRIEMIERLALAAEYRDEDTSDHNLRVGLLSSRLAEAIGWTAEDAGLLRRAAGAPRHRQDRHSRRAAPQAGRADRQRMRVMRTHPSIGARILGGSQVPLLQLAETVANSPSRKMGRHRLSARPEELRHSNRRPHRRGRRHLRCHHERSAVSKARSVRWPSRSCAKIPAAITSRNWSTRSNES